VDHVAGVLGATQIDEHWRHEAAGLENPETNAVYGDQSRIEGWATSPHGQRGITFCPSAVFALWGEGSLVYSSEAFAEASLQAAISLTAPATRIRQPAHAAVTRFALAAIVLGTLLPTASAQEQPAGILPLPPVDEARLPANQPSDLVVEVRIEGNETVEVSMLPKLITRAGQVFDPQSIETDVRSLHRSRKFVDIHPKYVRVSDGVVVIFQVVERPTIRYVKYVGNQRHTARTLRKKSEIDVGDAMDPYVIEEARRRIESFYHEKGYEAARVTTVEGSKIGDKGAVFLIDEGQSRKALWTSFVGNTIASDARLLTQVKTKPGFLWVFGGDVDREKIDADIEALTAYYRSLGFFQAKVGREVTVVHEGIRDWTHLTYVVSEGPRYNVRNVSFMGNSKFKEEFLERDLKLKGGKPFNQSQMDADLNLIRDIYGGRGFVFADIRADPRFLEEPGQIDLVYNVTEGQRYRVGKINVKILGEHPHTKHSVAYNRLSLRPGDILDIRKLRADERRLKSSSLFAADAAKGEGPRISFSKPEVDDTQMAGRQDSRFQSPDDGAEDAIVELTFDEDGVLERVDILPAAGAVSPQVSPSSSLAAEPVWRGQSPGYAQPQWPPAAPAQPYTQPYAQPQPQPFVAQPPAAWQPAQPQAAAPQMIQPQAQPYAQAQPFGQQPLVQPAVQQQAASPWGGQALAPAGPEALDYARMTAPPPPVYTVQQQVNGAQPPVFQGLQGDPTQPPGFQPGALPDFAGGGAAAVFPGNEPYVNLDVEAEETQTGRLMIGAGVNSNAGLVGNIVVDEQNFDILRLPQSWDDIKNGVAFRGAGQRFRLEASPGTQLQRYMATFQEPYLFDTRVGMTLSASYYTRYFFDWAEARTGGRVGLGYQFAFAPDLSVNAGFRGESVDVFNPRVQAPDIVDMLGTNSVYGFSAGIIHDTRDSPFMPTQGHLATFEFEQVIGTYMYPRGILEGRQYFLMRERPDGSGRHVLSVGSVLGMSGPDTPAYDNFFAGGYNTLRGFTFRGASPRQVGPGGQAAIVGGPFQWLNTVEYLFPITADDTLRGVVFTDFGTVESNVSINNMRVAPGFGLRITLPAMGPAPIALDFALPVVAAPFDSEQLFSFFVGFAR
jgi:outer membrane protein insertion porin family